MDIIIIGRDANTAQLKLTIGQQSKSFGSQNCVPQTVSRRHCSLTLSDDGSYKLHNLNPQNVTYVNGLECEAKTVTMRDRIELGPQHFLLDWDVVRQIVPAIADIRPLEAVWTEYDSHSTAQLIADRKFNALRGATGLVTMIAIIFSFVLGHGPIYIVFYVVAIFVTLFFTIKAYKDSSKVPLKNKKMKEDFQRNYVCPHCHHFLGFQSFEILSQYDACPYCKTKFRK